MPTKALTLLAVAVLAGCGGGAAPQGGAGDGNDTFATAEVVAVGSATAGTISSATDEDWYQFTTSGAGTVTVTLSGLTADADLALYDGAQAQVAASSNAGTASDTVTWAATAAGTFRALVVPVVAGAAYSLEVSFTPAPPPDGNDTFATAQPVTVGSTTAGAISSPTDDDWYRFTTTGPGTVIVMLSALTADANLALVDAAQVTLGTSAKAGTLEDTVWFVAGAGGDFYAHVIPVAASAAYSFTVGFVPAGLVDGNDTFATAQPVLVNTSFQAAVSSSTDDDWYVVTTPGPGTISVTLSGLMGDVDLELFGNAPYLQVGGSYWAGIHPDTVSYTTTGAATYHVRVKALASVTPYTLAISFTP